MMLLAHKIELKVNKKQATYFAKAAGCARKAYNWALAEWEQDYKNGEKPNECKLRRRLNSIKREQFPWMLEVTKNAPQMAIIQLGQAFKNFFAKRASYPTVRKKFRDDRFTITNDQFAVNDSRIRIPHLGWVRMRETLRWFGKIISATISRKADKWFVSITVETLISSTASENQAVVGVDLGVSRFATLSNGEEIIGPRPHKALLGRLKRLSRSLSRKQKKSKNRKKARIRLARLHYRIANIRNDAIHQLTTKLTDKFALIAIEDLHIKGMLKNRKLSRSIADMGFSEFRRQLIYKAEMRNKKIVIANRFYASSKICNNCDYRLTDLPLSIREWECQNCHQILQRDLNAAKNLEKWAVSSTVVTVCGASADGVSASALASQGALKQESNIKTSDSYSFE